MTLFKAKNSSKKQNELKDRKAEWKTTKNCATRQLNNHFFSFLKPFQNKNSMPVAYYFGSRHILYSIVK